MPDPSPQIMPTTRLEAFSDGVIAILITIMVFNFKVPDNADVYSLIPLLPVFLCYAMSFVYLGIYWNNHHHMFAATEHVNGAILWSNLHLLFWLSLVPFVTSWMGENHFATAPTVLYGVVLLMAALAYWLLQTAILNEHGQDSVLFKAVKYDSKESISIALYVIAIIVSFFYEWLACALYAVVAMIWLVPDPRIERALKTPETNQNP